MSYLYLGLNNNYSSFFNHYSVNVPNNLSYYSLLHFSLSSFFFSSQLLDLFSFENSSIHGNVSNVNYLLFSPLSNSYIILNTSLSDNSQSVPSVSELFSNASWLERECSELSNVFFTFNKDTSNLMLPYGESSSPFCNDFPSIGYHELYYNGINDNIISSNVSIQY